MAKLTQYRQIIQKILTEYRDWAAGSNQVGVQECVAFDQERDHYYPSKRPLTEFATAWVFHQQIA